MRNLLYSNSNYEYSSVLTAALSIKNFCTATVQELDSGSFVGSDGRTYKLYAPMYNWKEQLLGIIAKSNLSSGAVVYEHLRGLNILASVEYLPAHVKGRIKEAWATQDIPRVKAILNQKDESALFNYIDRVLEGQLSPVTISKVQNTVNELLYHTLGLVYEFDTSSADVFKKQLAHLRDVLTVRIKDNTFNGIVKAFQTRDAKALGALVVNCFHHPDFADRSLTSFLQEALNTIRAGAKYIDCSDLKGVVFNKPKIEVFIEYYNNIHSRAYPARLEEYSYTKRLDGKYDNRVYNYETGDYDTTYWSVSYAPKLRLHNAVGAPRGSRYSLTKDTVEPKDVFTVSVDRPEVLDEDGRPLEGAFTDSYTGKVLFYYTKKEGKAKYYTFRVIKEGKNTFYEYYLSSYQGEEVLVGGKSTVKKISHDNMATLLTLLGVEDISRMSTYRLCKTYITYVEFIKKHQDFLTGAFELAPSVHWSRAYEMLLVLDLIRIRSIARQFLRIYKEELIQFKREFGLNFSGLKPLEALELAYRVYNNSTSEELVETYGDITYFEDVIHKQR